MSKKKEVSSRYFISNYSYITVEHSNCIIITLSIISCIEVAHPERG